MMSVLVLDFETREEDKRDHDDHVVGELAQQRSTVVADVTLPQVTR